MRNTVHHEHQVAVMGEAGANELHFRVISPVVPHEWVSGSYTELLAAIIRSGLNKEGLDYLRTNGGQYWCEVGNLDPEAVMRAALKNAPCKYPKYHKGKTSYLEDISKTKNNTMKRC